VTLSRIGTNIRLLETWLLSTERNEVVTVVKDALKQQQTFLQCVISHYQVVVRHWYIQLLVLLEAIHLWTTEFLFFVAV
jgi:hypothetical protein